MSRQTLFLLLALGLLLALVLAQSVYDAYKTAELGACIARGQARYQTEDRWPILSDGRDGNQVVLSACTESPNAFGDLRKPET